MHDCNNHIQTLDFFQAAAVLHALQILTFVDIKKSVYQKKPVKLDSLSLDSFSLYTANGTFVNLTVCR